MDSTDATGDERQVVMTTDCPYLKPCPMFKLFIHEATKHHFVALYCRGPYQQCARFKLRQAGSTVPEKLLPDGQEMPEWWTRSPASS